MAHTEGRRETRTQKRETEAVRVDCSHICWKMDYQAREQSWRHKLGPCLQTLFLRDRRTRLPSHTETSEEADALPINESS